MKINTLSVIAVAAGLLLGTVACSANNGSGTADTNLEAAVSGLEEAAAAAADEASSQERSILPDGTYMFAQRDTCELFLDVYEPAEGSRTMIGDKAKPAIIFMFGGGFIHGNRDAAHYCDWFKALTDNGFRVISIDYRLGLKGSDKVGIAQVNELDNAIHMAVEDLFSATAFIIENADMFGIQPDNLVISGSSAGAISVLQAEYEICNRTEYTSVLPEGFNYAGVMSFSGAVLSRKGKLKFENEPCPILMFHGTADKLVNYKQIAFFNLGFFGSDKIAERLSHFGCNYNIIRYLDNGHEIAEIMDRTVSEQSRFIETNIMNGERKIIDALVSDPGIKRSGAQSRKDLYGN